MKQQVAVFLILFLFGALFLSVSISQQTFAKSAKDSKARRDINEGMGRATEGKFSDIKTVNISTYSNPNETITVYNLSSKGSILPRPIIPQEPPVCNRSEHLANGTCVPDTPSTNPDSGYKICMVGDFKDARVFDAMANQSCNYKIALGDNGYGKNLDLLKSIKPDKAICGNHDSAEDESTAIEKECVAYAGDSWWVKFGNATLMLGFNTNSDLTKQLNAAKNLISNSQFMQGVKNVITVSHKSGHVFPNAHHPAEAKTFYANLEKAIPSGIRMLQFSAHNHNSAAASNEGWYVAGSGGKSFYSCGIDQNWTFCNNKAIAYAQATIGNDGKIIVNFIDITGKALF